MGGGRRPSLLSPLLSSFLISSASGEVAKAKDCNIEVETETGSGLKMLGLIMAFSEAASATSDQTS